jgi:hypothetical protein
MLRFTGCNLVAKFVVWVFCALAALGLPVPAGLAARVAWVGALLSLVCAAASVPSIRHAGARSQPLGELTSRRVFAHLALFLGVSSGIIQATVLTMRIVYVSLDQLRGFPWRGVREYGFGSFGLWTHGALCTACALGLLATSQARLQTVLFWLVVMLTVWACYLSDPFQPTAVGGFERTDAMLILVECLASLVLVGVILAGWISDAMGRQVRVRGSDGAVEEVNGRIPGSAANLPEGFRASVTVIALGLNLAVLFQLLVPAGDSSTILRMSGFRAGTAALMAAAGGLLLLRKSWGGHLADATLGLAALGACGLATLAVPKATIPLDQRYPMILNAMVIGYAVAAGVFAHLGWSWAREGEPQSLRKRFLPHLNRFSFFCAAAALLSGVMMCFWPGVPGIATADDSLGRVLAGLGAFLLLLWVSLRSCRLLQRLSFHLLTVAVAASLVAFLAVRALPFVSHTIP